ncbi:MAG: isoprenylcysteine carboxylmethyltransferase family protein [Anaerolineae bacterium]|nr:isoprenylcysteine carboxylmethyltransferase family protein [Anaerolineae bacterium]
MQRYLAALTIVSLIGLVLTRSLLMQRQGIKAIHVGKLDQKDFVILPFALFYFYMIFANAFELPAISTQEFFQSESISWIGVCLCLAGLLLFVGSLISFGRSFRVGIDTNTPDKLIKTGVFAFSRNPIYVAFWMVLLGEFLIFPNWILLLYLALGTWLLHRQVLREEAYLSEHYDGEYAEYMTRVRRYI